MPDFDPAAEEATLQWLSLIDAGDAHASWQAAAALFRLAVPEQRWAESLDVARAPLGKVVSRRLKEGRTVNQLPGAPDGEYVVFQFETTFELKRSAVETVTPMREKDREWRVSGYFVR